MTLIVAGSLDPVGAALAVKYYALPLLLLLVVPIPRPALRRLAAAGGLHGLDGGGDPVGQDGQGIEIGDTPVPKHPSGP